MNAPNLPAENNSSKKDLETSEQATVLPPEQARLAMLENQLKEKELLLKEVEVEEKRDNIKRNNRSAFLQKEFLIVLVTSLAGIAITSKWNDNEKIMMRSEIGSKASIIQKLEENIASERKTSADTIADLKLQRLKLETELTTMSEKNTDMEKKIHAWKSDFDKAISDANNSAHRKHEELANALRAIIAVMSRGDEEFRQTRDLFQLSSERNRNTRSLLEPNQNDEKLFGFVKLALLEATGNEKSLSEAAISHLMTCKKLLSSRTDDVIEIATKALAGYGEFYQQPNFDSEPKKNLKATPKGFPIK